MKDSASVNQAGKAKNALSDMTNVKFQIVMGMGIVLMVDVIVPMASKDNTVKMVSIQCPTLKKIK